MLSVVFVLSARAGKKNRKNLSQSGYRLGIPKRSPVISARMLEHKSVSSLHGDFDGKRQGLKIYKIVRARLRELANNRPEATRSNLGMVDGFMVDRLDVRSNDAKPKRNILVLAGTHGKSELAGVEAAIRLADDVSLDDDTLQKYNVTVIPALSPTALIQQSRRNKHGQDIDTSFSQKGASREAQLIKKLFEKEHFDLIFDLRASKETNKSYAVRGGKEEEGFANKFMRGAIPANYLARGMHKSSGRKFSARGVSEATKKDGLNNWFFKQGNTFTYKLVVPSTSILDNDASRLVKILKSAMKRF